MSRGYFKDDLPNWWGYKKQHDNYYLRFKYAYNQNTWKQAFPNELQDMANQYWIIASTLFSDLWINANTTDKAQGLLAYVVLQNKGILKRLQEVNNVSLTDWYSQDIMNNLTSHNDFESDSNGESNTNANSTDGSQNFNVNNDLEDPNADKASWETSKNMTNADSSQSEQNQNGTSSSHTKQSNDSTRSLESKTTQYKANDMIKLLGVAVDGDIKAFGNIINGIAAPIQNDQETLHDWRGDF